MSPAPSSARRRATKRPASPGKGRRPGAPALFLIDVAALRSRKRRRRLVLISLTLLVGAFFGVALVQAQLVQTQSDLDALEGEIDQLENDIALLERDVVVASSPEEIVRRARELGMVRAVRPVYLVATRPVSR